MLSGSQLVKEVVVSSARSILCGGGGGDEVDIM